MKGRRFFLFDTSDYTLPHQNKWELVGDMVRQIVPASLILKSQRAALDDVYLSHSADFVNRFMTNELGVLAQKRIGFPWSLRAVNRVFHTTGATVEAARKVYDELQAGHCTAGAAVIGAGAHHAHYDFGSGYCVFNDQGNDFCLIFVDFAKHR